MTFQIVWISGNFFRFLILTLTVSNNCACNAARHVGEKSVCIKLKLYKSPWEFISVLFVWNLSTIRFRARERTSEFPIEFNIKLVHWRFASVSNHFHLIKAIYQLSLNKYNKTWLNTNLLKTPNFVYRRVPVIASNILRNVSLQVTGKS